MASEPAQVRQKKGIHHYIVSFLLLLTGRQEKNEKVLFSFDLKEHSYIVDSFEEFEALARRALHEDLHTGAYLVQANRSTCDRLCKEQTDCCHPKAECNCGTHTVLPVHHLY